MKKIKFIPAILMLVLCVGVLAVGIYAIKPSKNTITGQITINASNAEVAIVGYIDDVEVFKMESVRAGASFTIAKDKIEFKSNNVNTVEDLGTKTLRINIKNKSSKSLGAYFYNGVALPADNYATEEHIAIYQPVKSNNNLVASLHMDSYSYLAPNDDEDATNTTYDEINMHCVIQPEMLNDSTENLEVTFNLALNIEDYVATPNLMNNIVGAATPTSVGSQNVSGLVKFPETETEFAARAFANNQNIDYVCFPSSYESILINTFYSSSLKGVFLPDSLKTFGNQVFCLCKNLVSVTLPNGLSTISQYMFSECESLKYVRMPESLQTINYGGFYKCYSLYQIDFPAEVLTIGQVAFVNCTNLTIVNFNNKLETIGIQAFGHTNIEVVELPASIEMVKTTAFWPCGNLRQVILPEVDHLVTLEDSAFCGENANEEGLLNITGEFYIPNNYFLAASEENNPSNGPFSATKISSFKVNDDNNLYFTKDGILYRRSSSDPTSELYEVPNRLEAYPCYSPLRTVTIPSTVTQIRRYELVNAVNLTYIYVDNGNSVYAAKDGILYQNSDTDNDGVYDAILTVPTKYTLNTQRVKNIVVPEGVKVIGGLYSGTISNTSAISGYGFIGRMSGDIKVTLPSTTVVIAGSAFQMAKNIVSINSNVEGTFDLSGLNLASIGYKAFEICTKLENLIISKYTVDGEEQSMYWGEGFVLYASSLQTITFDGTKTPKIGYFSQGYTQTLAGNFANLAEGFVLKVPTGCKDTFITDWQANINSNTALTSYPSIKAANLTALENFESQIEEYAVA